VSAAEESNIRDTQFRTIASVKSKEKAYKDMNEMSNTKIYKSLGSLQKNPRFDPNISYNFEPELEFGFIIAVRGVREEANWIPHTVSYYLQEASAKDTEKESAESRSVRK
jgi:hypothetical protein